MERWKLNNKHYETNDSLETQVVLSYLLQIFAETDIDIDTEDKVFETIRNNENDVILKEIREYLLEDVEEPAHFMELGNLLWGNSRGEYAIERGKWEDKFCELVETANLDYHGIVIGESEYETDRGGYENETFVINPYYWGDNDDIAEEPNFIYKPTGYEIQWYKYPLRDAYANKKLTYSEFAQIIDDCINSILSPKDDFRFSIGDVVQTINGFDRGLVTKLNECGRPAEILAAPGFDERGTYGARSVYGGIDSVMWYKTGESMTEEEWFERYSGDDGWERYCRDREDQRNLERKRKWTKKK